jgi:hypothetical protein
MCDLCGEADRIHLVLVSMQIRTFCPYLAWDAGLLMHHDVQSPTYLGSLDAHESTC